MTLTRRALLAGLAGGAAAGLVPACARDTGSGGDGSDVIVIGAGVSGLAAARELANRGRTVTVLEGRDRIGGRIWTSTAWPGVPLDLGASWIHGIDGNPIHRLATDIGARTVVTDGDSITYYMPDGREATAAEASALESWGERVSKALTSYQDGSDTDSSIRAVVRAALESRGLGDADREMLSYNLNEIEQEYAGSVDQLSALYFDSDDPIEGDDVAFPDGYGAITDHLGAGLQIRTGHTVTAVDWDTAGVTVTTDRGTLRAGAAVITLPLGVLQSGRVAFAAGLPAAKETAIRRLGVGVLNKCYLRFAETFWADSDWLGYIPRAEGQWAQWINVERISGAPVLLGFNAADFGRSIEEWTDARIVESAMATLRTIYGSSVPNPVDHQITRWASDGYALGSYSFNKVGSDPDMRDDLAAAIGGRVFFAGEATDSGSFATVHGAYRSGLRAAREITGQN